MDNSYVVFEYFKKDVVLNALYLRKDFPKFANSWSIDNKCQKMKNV